MDQRLIYQHVEHQQHVPMHAIGDVTAYGVIGATFLGWLPHIAAGLSIIYLIIQIIMALRTWYKDK